MRIGLSIAAVAVAALVCSAATPAAAQQRTGPTPPIGNELEGTSWQAESLDGRPVADPAQMTIDFLPGQEAVRGQAGCNRFAGPFASRADKLTMGILRQSRSQCTPEQAAVQKAYIDMLHAAWRAELDFSRLTLHGRNGEQITFAPRPR